MCESQNSDVLVRLTPLPFFVRPPPFFVRPPPPPMPDPDNERRVPGATYIIVSGSLASSPRHHSRNLSASSRVDGRIRGGAVAWRSHPIFCGGGGGCADTTRPCAGRSIPSIGTSGASARRARSFSRARSASASRRCAAARACSLISWLRK